MRAGCLAGALAAALVSAAASGASSALISTVAGTGSEGFLDGAAATSARLDGPRGVAIEADGSLLIADRGNDRIRRLSGGTITTVAGDGDRDRDDEDEGQASTDPLRAPLKKPSGVAATGDGGYLIADTGNHVIRRVRDGVIATTAGTGQSSDGRDDLAADESALDSPEDVAPTSDGGYLIADTGNHKIREVTPEGTVHTLAGTGSQGFAGDGGPAVDAELKDPSGVTALPGGGYLIADTGNKRIRRVTPAGEITTVASAGLDRPTDAVLVAGGFAISDSGGDRIRHRTADGVLETIAGTGASGYNGDDIPASSAQLNDPSGIALAPDGRVYVADSANHRIRAFAGPTTAGAEDPTGDDGLGEDPPDDDGLAGPSDEGEEPEPAPGNGRGGRAALSPPAPPMAGRRVNVSAVRGTVTVKKRGVRGYVALTDAASVPVGSIVNARHGAVRLVSAADLKGRRQAAVFHSGAFAVRQKRSRRPVTELVLSGGGLRSCARRAKRAGGPGASFARRARRGLWGRGRGRFRTRGRNGSATVRGTIWFTRDSCAGTLVRVRRGRVAVRDFARARTVNVRAGGSYFARARGPGRRRKG